MIQGYMMKTCGIKMIVTGVDASRDKSIITFANDLDGDQSLFIAFMKQYDTEANLLKKLN